MDPQSLRYTKTHEWAFVEGDTCTVGVSQFAADQLTDVTYLELPPVGTQVKAGESCGTIETVKAVNDLYAPCTGEVTAVNAKLEDDPNLITQEPLGAGWMFKVRLAGGSNLDHLQTYEQYQKQIAEEEH
jgi:glycine cleavage system H protein